MEHDIIVVGASLGGLRAVETLVSGLPGEFPLPVVVVQHRAAHAGPLLRQLLQRRTPLRVREPQDKDDIEAGRVYLAPPDYHLMVEPGSFALSTEGKVSYARPSIDVLFESAADAYRRRVIGIIMTGANEDGAAGSMLLKACGGFLIVQDPSTAECPVMPNAALSVAQPDRVLALEEIGPFLAEFCRDARNT